MSIHEKAMLVYLAISSWSARKYDRKISQEIEAQYQADEAGRYNKILIAKEHLANISKTISAVRTFHYENTLPWSDNGGRLLTAAHYFDYMAKMQSYQSSFERECSDFIAVYPNLKEEAKQRLNGMFNEEDYPDVSNLKAKFDFKLTILPVPEADDFRVNLQDSEVETIKESIQQQLLHSTETAMQDLWKRLYGVVEHMAERLSKEEHKFKDSLVKNISELCELLPKLNITDNPQLETARLEILQKLTVNNPATLRENQIIRSKTAKEAQAILNKMKSYVA
jgi:hypothetical protein